MARHHRDLMYCRKMSGIAIGKLCEKCDGKGVSDAYYCKECTELEKDRDGCPRILNIGSARASLVYEHKKQGGSSQQQQPSKITTTDLKPPTNLGTSKRKETSAAATRGSQLHQPGTLSSIPVANRKVKAPTSKLDGTRVETVHAGRRSSQGFKVTPKQERNPDAHGAKNAGNGPKFTTGAIPRPLPGGPRGGSRQIAKPGVGRRLPPARTSITQGRTNEPKPGAGPTKLGTGIHAPEGIKRQRLAVPTGLDASPLFGKAVTKAGENASEPMAGSETEDNEDDDDDDDEEVGPPPVLCKRTANDYDGRLKDLEAFSRYMIKKNKTTTKKKKLLSVELEQNGVQMTQLQYDNKLLLSKAEEAEKQVKSLQERIEERDRALQDSKRRQEDDIDELQRRHKRQTEELHDEQRALQKAVNELQESLDATKISLRTKKDENTRLEATISKQTSDQVELESSNRSLKAKVEHLENVVNEREIRIAELEEDVASRSQTIDELETKLRKEETHRRRLHNTIQELKGNIRVFCRVRPLVGQEKDAGAALPVSLPECDDKNEIELSQSSESALGKTTSKNFPFKFDRVFAPQSTQDEVFEDVSQLIQSALDGYPVCIFAYGQTGSGKTHTMQGPDSLGPGTEHGCLGVIPRAVKQIYENTSKLAERGWEYTLEGQFLEIYNETLQDLLAPAGRPAQSSSSSDKQTKLEIYQDTEGHTRVKNVTTVKVDGAERVHWLLARAAENRTVAATNCNERSSRSHSVFTLYLCGKNSLTGESSSGVLNLIDLAGSERLSASGSSGDRLKETQAINKSLACLGDVIAALAKGNRHIPYRNSKLTHLLQESLGAGNSKTLMFVCINPSPSSAQESLCSLQFATKVNSCQIGTARRQAAS
ncbi:kinesin-like nuclear fusion protein [Coemansia sp. RSA 487]|nr:kinesin-like nuclear fusion protein [Coemansia sp. RSA 487]